MIEEKTEIYDDELIRLVSSNANTSSQYVIFTNAEDDLFAINVAKVEELITSSEIKITKGDISNPLILGISKIRDNLVTMCRFDDWLGTEIKNEADIKLVILANYSNKRTGILIKSVVGIQSFESSTFLNDGNADEKIIHIVEIVNANERKLCKIFDTDRLIMDIHPNMQQIAEDKVTKIESQAISKKLVILAEDSKLIQKSIKKLFDKVGYNYEIFDNGALCLERLNELDPNDISIIITDIEMPVMDGMELMDHIKRLQGYENIPVVVNTNMANNAVITSSYELGAKEVIKKLDLEKLNNIIVQYANK